MHRLDKHIPAKGGDSPGGRNSQKGIGTMPGRYEWLIVLLVIILLFGAKRLPEVAKGLGKGIREFKKAKDEIDQEVDTAQKEIKEQVRDLDS